MLKELFAETVWHFQFHVPVT